MQAELPIASAARILVIEDHEEVRRSLVLVLRSSGFAVDAYASGIELLSSRALPSADCLVIDYKLPSVDGFELLARIRAKGLNCPALMITGFASTTLKARALAAGYAGVLLKPLVAGELISQISEQIQPSH
jgi:two-component system response regulator FixJ